MAVKGEARQVIASQSTRAIGYATAIAMIPPAALAYTLSRVSASTSFITLAYNALPDTHGGGAGDVTGVPL